MNIGVFSDESRMTREDGWALIEKMAQCLENFINDQHETEESPI